ncbi:MAG: hypothetical protein LBR26_09850 [Prevotella sp.]|jgi:hypothetical protein|nr:hypothetical protein [Prevotella sp.]
MPIYVVNGRKANVRDVAKFLKLYPNAQPLDSQPTGGAPSDSVPYLPEAQKSQRPAPAPPAVRAPAVRVPEVTHPADMFNPEKLGFSNEVIDVALPNDYSKHKDDLLTDREIYEHNVRNLADGVVKEKDPIDLFGAQLNLYKSNPRYKTGNTSTDYSKLPMIAKEYLKKNKVTVEEPIYSGGEVRMRTVKKNTPEQIEAVKDFIANSEMGVQYMNSHQNVIKELNKAIDPLIKQGEDIIHKEATEAINRHEKRAMTDLYGPAIPYFGEKYTLASKAVSLLKNAKSLLSAEKEGGGFWKGLKPNLQEVEEFLSMSEFLGDLRLNDVISKYEKNPESLTAEENLAIQAKFIADQIMAGVDPGNWYNIGSTTKKSLPFIRDFLLTAPLGGEVSGFAKAGASKLATKAGASLLSRMDNDLLYAIARKTVNKNTVSIVRKAGKVGIDMSVRPAVQSMFSPSSYAMAFEEMQGQAYDKDADGNIKFGNRKSFGHGAASAFIENQSEVLGEVVINKILQKFKIPVPKVFDNNFTRRAGIQGPFVEFTEEKYADLANVVRGEQTIEGFFDPRQNLETFGAVAVMQIPFSTVSTLGYMTGKIGDAQAKRSLKMAYEAARSNLFQYFGNEGGEVAVKNYENTVHAMYKSGNAKKAESELKKELVSIMNEDAISDNAKRAMIEYISVYFAYYGMDRGRLDRIRERQRRAADIISKNADASGRVMTARTKLFDGEEINIKADNIVLNEDGTINRDKSSGIIIYADPVDGTPKQLSINDILEITSVDNADDLKKMADAAIQDETEKADAVDEAPVFNIGDNAIVTINGVDLPVIVTGQTEGGYIVQDAIDGAVYNVGALDVKAAPEAKDPYVGQSVNTDYNGSAVKIDVTGRQGDFYTIDVTDSDGNVSSHTIAAEELPALFPAVDSETSGIEGADAVSLKRKEGESEGSASGEQSNLTDSGQIPKDEKGNMQFELVPVETTVRALKEVYSDVAKVLAVVNAYTSKIQEQLKEAKAPEITGDIREDVANQQAFNQNMEKLGKSLEYWQGVKNAVEAETRQTDNGQQKEEIPQPATLTETEVDVVEPEAGTATGPAVETESKEVEADKAVYGAANKIISTERYDELRKQMRGKMNNMNSGFDPELFIIGGQMAMYHIEAGAHKFADFAERMIESFGDGVRPYLKSFYEQARFAEEMKVYENKIDAYDTVKGFDVDGFKSKTQEVKAQEVKAQEVKAQDVKAQDVKAQEVKARPSVFDASSYEGAELYHGSPEGKLKFIDPYTHTRNWKEGIGFYTTESSEMAKGYAEGRTAKGERKGKASETGAVTSVAFPSGVKILDMEAPADMEMWNDVAERLDVMPPKSAKSNMDAYGQLIAEYNEETDTGEGQYEVEDVLREVYGYDASTHIEGKRKGTPHRVFIWKNDSKLPGIKESQEVREKVTESQEKSTESEKKSTESQGKVKEGERATIRFFNGQAVTGDVVSRKDGKISVKDGSGFIYSVPESRIIDTGVRKQVGKGKFTPIAREALEKIVKLLKKTGMARNVFIDEESIRNYEERLQSVLERKQEISHEKQKGIAIDALRAAEKTGYIDTGKLDEEGRKIVLVPKYTVKWFYGEDNPDIDYFDSMDEAFEDLKHPGSFDEVSAYFVPYKEADVYFKVARLDEDGDVEETNDKLDFNDALDKGFLPEIFNGLRSKWGDTFLDNRTFENPVESSRELLDEVYYNINNDIIDKYEGYRIGTIHTGKYRSLDIYDSNDNLVDVIQLRIADHPYNPANNDTDARSGKFISVEVFEKDPTRGRFNGRYSLQFNSNSEYDEIVEAVNERIREIIDDNMDSYEAKEMRTRDGGRILGLVTEDGDVYIDPSRMNANTPIHEFGHLWNTFIYENFPELWEAGKKPVIGSTYWNEVINDAGYSYLLKGTSKEKVTESVRTGESIDEATDYAIKRVMDESLAHFIGDNGEAEWHARHDLGTWARMKAWLHDVWNAIGKRLGLKPGVNLENMTLKDFADMAVKDLLGGKNLYKKYGVTEKGKWGGQSRENRAGERQADQSKYDFDVEGITDESAVEMSRIKSEAVANGTFMKAPNGKKTNLNERQWLQTRTKSFMNWFGDWLNDPENASKVVDENGEPKVVAHSSNKEFTIFRNKQENDSGWLGAGYYFFGDRSMDGQYGKNVMETFLNVRDPYYAVNEDQERLMELNDNSESEEFTNNLKEEGFDGVFFNGNLNQEWVAFSPSQIKSATDNNGNFDERSDDIRFHLEAGEEESALEKTVSNIPEPPVFTKKDTLADIMARHKQFVEETQTFKEAFDELVKKSALEEWRDNRVNEFQDDAKPLERFLKAIEKMGGKLYMAIDPYNDYFRSKGRAKRALDDYERNYINPLAGYLNDIVNGKRLDVIDNIVWKIGTNKKKGESLDNYDKISVYLQAKDMVESEELGLVPRGAKGFEKSLGFAGSAEKFRLAPRDYIDMFEDMLGMDTIDELWKLVNRATGFALDYQLKHGYTDQDTYDKYRGRKYYVPERGWRERDMGKDQKYVKDAGRFNNNPYNAALVKAKGRESLAGDPLAFIKSIAQSSILSVEKNRTKAKFLDFALKNQDIGRKTGAFTIKKLWYVKTDEKNEEGLNLYRESSVPPDSKMIEADKALRGQIAELRKSLKTAKTEQDRDAIQNDINSLSGQIRIAGRVNEDLVTQRTSDEKRQHQVKAVKDGVEYVIELSDAEAANVLNRNAGKAEFSGQKGITVVTKTMSSLMTQYNPEFALRNAMRDAGSSIIYSHAEFGNAYTGRYIKNIGLSQRSVWEYVLANNFKNKDSFDTKTGKMLEEFFEDGAATGYSYMKDIDHLRDDMRKLVDPNMWQKAGTAAFDNTIGVLGNVFGALTEASELTFRFATYKTSRESGYTREEAATHAKEVTVNFDRSGSNRFFRSFFAFFNPAIQGSSKYLKAAGKSREIRVLSALYVAMGYLNTLLQPDDPDDERSWGEYDRMQNLVLGSVKLALPQTFRAFHGIGVQAALAQQGRKTIKASLVDGLKYFASEFSPDSPFNLWDGFEVDRSTNSLGFDYKGYAQSAAPTMISPLADVVLNRDFADRKVHNEPYVKSKEGAVPHTTMGTMNVSPAAQWFTDHVWKLAGGRPDLEAVSNTDGSPIGGLANVNPSDIEHIVTGYVPGIGKFLIDLAGSAIAVTEGKFDVSNMVMARVFVKPYREDKAFYNAYYNLKGKAKAYKNMLDAYEKAEKSVDNSELSEYASKALDRIYKSRGTKESEVLDLYLEADRLLKDIDKKGEAVSKEDIKAMDAMIIKWNRK